MSRERAVEYEGVASDISQSFQAVGDGVVDLKLRSLGSEQNQTFECQEMESRNICLLMVYGQSLPAI
jgi:hypothetical protein